MKKIVLILSIGAILLACASCSDSDMQEVCAVISEVESPLTPEQADVLNSLKPELLRGAAFTATKADADRLYTSEKEFDKIDFATLPYFELNEEEFISDPSTDNFMNCIHPVADKILYVGKKDNNLGMILEAVNREGEWNQGLCLEGINYFRTNFMWLPQELMTADNKKYYMLNAIGLVYVVFEKNGEPVFCDFIGTNTYTKKQFAAIMLNRKNLKDNTTAYFKKWNEEKKIP